MSSLESFRAYISKMQHEAEEALVRGDVGPRLRMWSRTDPVTLFAAVGATKSGWAELEPTFHAVASRLSDGHDVRYEITACEVSENMGWSAGFLRFTGTMDGGQPRRFVLRLTHIYRREMDEWKVVHEHSDFQPPD